MKKTQYVAAGILYLVVLVVGITATLAPGNKESAEQWWALALTIVACHIYLSVVVINEKQLGAMFILGRVVGDLESGPHFAFWPFCYVHRETKNMIQIEIGVLTDEERKKAKELESSASLYLLEDPLFVNWGDVKSAMPVKGGSPTKKEEENMFRGNPYGDAMVTDTHVTVRFRISSLTKLINKAGSLAEGIELVQKVVTSTLVSHAGKSFVGRVIRDMEAMDEELKKAVEEFVVDPNSDPFKVKPQDSWGIDVEKTQITRLGTSRRINVAIADKGKVIYAAQAEKVKRQEEGIGAADAIKAKAEADRIRLTKEGIGNAEAAKLLLFAQQKGTKELAKLAKTEEGKLILQLQALERALEKGNPVVIPADLSGILGALASKFGHP